jgi:hypothetical protein
MPDRGPEDRELEARVISALRHTQGTMPIVIVVADEATRDRALAIRRGRKHAALVDVVTEAQLHERGHG